MTELKVISRSFEETQEIGKFIGEKARPGDVYLLVGQLGAGKTCLTRGLLWGLGSGESARSPTFVIISHYVGRLILYHMDFYRLNDAQEAFDLGIDEYFYGNGVCVVEWADRVPEVFPEDYMKINIEYLDDNCRQLCFSTKSVCYSNLLEEASLNFGASLSKE